LAAKLKLRLKVEYHFLAQCHIQSQTLHSKTTLEAAKAV